MCSYISLGCCFVSNRDAKQPSTCALIAADRQTSVEPSEHPKWLVRWLARWKCILDDKEENVEEENKLPVYQVP